MPATSEAAMCPAADSRTYSLDRGQEATETISSQHTPADVALNFGVYTNTRNEMKYSEIIIILL